jgi:hypothetical protein
VEQALTSGVLVEAQPKPKRKRTFLKWSLAATALLLTYFMWQFGSGFIAGARLSDDAVRLFHSQLDSGAYDEVLRESAWAFQNSESREELLKVLVGEHSKLGVWRSSTRTNIAVNVSTNGTSIKVTYQSTFKQGNATETFTWRKTAGGGLSLIGYNVQSNAFISK